MRTIADRRHATRKANARLRHVADHSLFVAVADGNQVKYVGTSGKAYKRAAKRKLRRHVGDISTGANYRRLYDIEWERY